MSRRRHRNWPLSGTRHWPGGEKGAGLRSGLRGPGGRGVVRRCRGSQEQGGGQETHCATVWLINPKQGDNGGGTQWQEMGQIVSILVLSPTKYSFSVRHKLDIVSLFGGAEIIQFSTTQIIFKFGMCFPNVSFREIANCEGSLLGSVKSFLLAQ